MRGQVVFLILCAVATACDLRRDESDESRRFLGGDTPSRASPDGDAVRVDGLTQSVKVSSGEWEALTVRVKRCEAERQAESRRMDSELEAARAEGRASCMTGLEKAAGERAAEVIRQTVVRADEFMRELRKFKFGYAIVNGDCVAKMSDGHTRAVRVKGDACLSVPFIKVGTGDGEVKGIEDAVSADAMTDGILSLSCDVGRAHIRMTADACGAGSGSVAKSTFEKI
jgi:hypothetical protein